MPGWLSAVFIPFPLCGGPDCVNRGCQEKQPTKGINVLLHKLSAPRISHIRNTQCNPGAVTEGSRARMWVCVRCISQGGVGEQPGTRRLWARGEQERYVRQSPRGRPVGEGCWLSLELAQPSAQAAARECSGGKNALPLPGLLLQQKEYSPPSCALLRALSF